MPKLHKWDSYNKKENGNGTDNNNITAWESSFDRPLGLSKVVSGVSGSTERQQNMSATLLIEVGYFFPKRRSN